MNGDKHHTIFKPFISLPDGRNFLLTPTTPGCTEFQKNIFWEFGSKEDHFKYRNAVMQTYKYGNFPVFEGYNHMQYQILDPKGFAEMLESIIETDQ